MVPLSCGPVITRSILVLALLAAVAPADAALDLTGTPEEYVNEGIVYKRLVFKDDRRRVEMEFPPGWKIRTAASDRLELTPSGKGFAAAVIERQPRPTPGALDDVAIKGLAQQALAALPPDCQATVLHAAVDSDGSGAGEVILSYKSLGYTFRRSVRFVNRPECHLMAQISAPEAEFPALHGIFRRAVQSLTWN